MQSRSLVAKLLAIFSLMTAAPLASSQSFADGQSGDIPSWLKEHVGKGDGQIAEIVLQRARALYLRKLREGVVKNPCYFAMDATRPNDLGDSRVGRRFYVVCEAKHEFRAVSAGHGGGRDWEGVGNFSNGKRCAKNFSNAVDSKLTAGGTYVTAETKTSFKGYYRVSAKQDAILNRSFVQFDGEGATANARQREIGGHAAMLLKEVCLRKDPHSPYANKDGYVPFGKLTNYDGGRSNGCTTWSPSDAQQIITTMRDDPTTLYIYPEAADVDAVAQVIAVGRSLSSTGMYWNDYCLKEIGTPKFWKANVLEPILREYRKAHPTPPDGPIPICKGS